MDIGTAICRDVIDVGMVVNPATRGTVVATEANDDVPSTPEVGALARNEARFAGFAIDAIVGSVTLNWRNRAFVLSARSACWMVATSRSEVRDFEGDIERAFCRS